MELCSKQENDQSDSNRVLYRAQPWLVLTLTSASRTEKYTCSSLATEETDVNLQDSGSLGQLVLCSLLRRTGTVGYWSLCMWRHYVFELPIDHMALRYNVTPCINSGGQCFVSKVASRMASHTGRKHQHLSRPLFSKYLLSFVVPWNVPAGQRV